MEEGRRRPSLRPAGTWILDFCLLNCEKVDFCYSSSQSEAFWYGSLSRLIRHMSLVESSVPSWCPAALLPSSAPLRSRKAAALKIIKVQARKIIRNKMAVLESVLSELLLVYLMTSLVTEALWVAESACCRGCRLGWCVWWYTRAGLHGRPTPEMPGLCWIASLPPYFPPWNGGK